MYQITHCQRRDKRPKTIGGPFDEFTMGGYFEEPDALDELTSRIINDLTQDDSSEDVIRDITNHLQGVMNFLQSVRINSRFSISTAFSNCGVGIQGFRDGDAHLSMTVRTLKPNEDSSGGTRIEDIITLGWSKFGDLTST